MQDISIASSALSPRVIRTLRNAGMAGLTAILLSSCASLKPSPISEAEHIERANNDYKKIYAAYVPVEAPLTLSDAIARALKYNFDAELAKSEITLQQQQADLSLYQLLPRLAADAGYNWRNNHNAAESVDVITEQRSLAYSYSEERIHNTADLQISWNLLDAGVSYFQAKQQGYRALVAVERRRKVIDGIIKNVQQAYWRAASAERILPHLEPLLHQAEGSLNASRQSVDNNLEPQMQALDYQQNMLQVISQIKRMRSDLKNSKLQLAALINMPEPGNLKLAKTSEDFNPAISKADVHRLERISLVQRPELREAAYEEKIDTQDVYKEMVKMMPGVNFMAGLQTDSNRYLYNDNWSEMGIRASWNLLSLVEGPKAISAAKKSVEISRTRRLALSVAVLTQVNLSYNEYLLALDDYKTSQKIHTVEQRIRKASANALQANTQSRTDHVRRELGAMVAQLQRDQAQIQVHTALVNLYSAVGQDLVPASADVQDLAQLSKNIDGAIANWQAGEMPSDEMNVEVAPSPKK